MLFRSVVIEDALPNVGIAARYPAIKPLDRRRPGRVKYAHIGIDDQAKAVANLPTAALHGRCISGVSEGQSLATRGTNATGKKRQNPCKSKGFGNGRHSVAKIAKVEDRGLEPLDAAADQPPHHRSATVPVENTRLLCVRRERGLTILQNAGTGVHAAGLCTRTWMDSIWKMTAMRHR